MNDYNKRTLKNVLEDYREKNDIVFLKEIEEASNNPHFANSEADYKTFEKKFNKAIEKSKKIRKILLRVASIFLVLLIGATITTLSVKSFRERIWNYIFNTKNDSYSILVVSDNDYDNKLSEYEGKYVPTWIPEGYEVSSVENASSYNVINFIKNSGESIIYHEYSQNIDTKLLIDKESCDTYETKNIANRETIFASINGSFFVIIKADNAVIHVACNDSDFDFYGFAAHIEEK